MMHRQTAVAQAVAGEVWQAQDLLWIPAALLFGVGDILTTSVGLSLGAEETSRLVRFLVNDVGGGVWSFWALKSFVIIALLVMSFLTLGKHRWITPVLLCVVSVPLLTMNLVTIAGLL